MATISFTKLDSAEIDENESLFQPLQRQHISLFGKPKEIGHFSIDSDRKIHFNKSQMKYLISSLKTHNLKLDLNTNFKSDVTHNYVTVEKMYQMLHWMKHHKSDLKCFDPSSTEMLKVDFVTVRGTLARIMCTPYISGFYRDQWEVCASKFNGIIYFSAIDSDADVMENENASEKLLQFQAWGYKFEQYMTTDKIDGKPDTTSNYHQLEEFCVVLKNVLNKYTLLYKAEVDAVVPGRHPAPGSGDTSCYTELKTSRIIHTLNQQQAFTKHKLVNWWAQSYLAGIPEIICGRRTDDGMVKSLQILRVSSLPKEGQDHWSADSCLNFCDKFLNFLKKTVIEDNHNVVYKFTYKSKEMIHCAKLVNPEPRYRVIPEWYKVAMDDVKDLSVKKGA